MLEGRCNLPDQRERRPFSATASSSSKLSVAGSGDAGGARIDASVACAWPPRRRLGRQPQPPAGAPILQHAYALQLFHFRRRGQLNRRGLWGEPTGRRRRRGTDGNGPGSANAGALTTSGESGTGGGAATALFCSAVTAVDFF